MLRAWLLSAAVRGLARASGNRFGPVGVPELGIDFRGPRQAPESFGKGTMSARIVASLTAFAVAAGAAAQGVLEVPAENSTQSGIGVVSGWHCDALRIEVAIDEGPPLLAGSGTERLDTASVCGHPD